MRILIGLFAWWRLLAVFVDVDVAIFISGDDDDDVIAAVAVIAVVTLSEVSVNIAVVITDGIRNNVDISKNHSRWAESEEEK